MFRRLAAAVLLSLAASHPLAAAEVDPALLAGLQARSIGPAGMSGRIAAIEAVESDPDTVYVGAATGGLWKSTNGGLTWEPIFDDQPVAAVGAVAVFQANPDIVWVGTGEGNPRNSVSVGNGVYKSLDGGRTWSHMGLESSERIHRIALHPTDPNTAYVAALGAAWGENPERGVFKTTDGGATWEKILYVDERTGGADLAMDPTNPNKLFAALWEYRRWPWFFRSGGEGSGLYVTYDGGGTWKRYSEDDGLPAGELGRIGVAICRHYPNVVYALVEAEESALLRSEDGGRTWAAVNREPDVAQRPFYYADLRVDPAWPNRLYNLAGRVRVSDDGGKSFQVLGGSRQIHGDYHALWIDPADPEHLVIGNDGGVAVSDDRGSTFRFVANLPLAQYYHIAVDMDTPYNVYGGMQDNGSWRGPSAVRGGDGIPNHRWLRVGIGDGFDTQPDPENPRRGYSMWQGGNLLRWNLDSGEIKPIRPPQPDDEELRFNWNAGLAIDPFDPATIYYGSQFVHKSPDRGDSWTVISPDLTTDNPEWQRQRESGGLTPDVTGAENFTTILTIAPSPVERGVIWVGTDDGRLHVTRDGGASWQSVEGNVPGVPEGTWIPHVEASRFDAAEAFVVFDDHRRSNWTPYVFRTRDYGASWQSLAGDELWGYALAIEQDPVDRDLLFLGTEFGLYVSLDGGASWLRWKHGLPTVAVRDVLVHPREGDLVLGTHGRAAFIIDDISSLRQLNAEVTASPLHLFPVAATRDTFPEPSAEGGGLGAGEFEGTNRPAGALITYWLDQEDLPHPDPEVESRRREERRRQTRLEGAGGEAGGGEAAEAAGTGGVPRGARGRRGEGGEGPQVEIEIARDGEVVRTFEGPAKLGLNRAVWDLGRDPFRRPPGSRGGWRDRGSGPTVPPGTYTVTVRYGGHEAAGSIEVLAPLGSSLSDADVEARERAIRRAGALQDAFARAVERIVEARDDIEVVVAKARRAGEEASEDTAAEGAEEEGGEASGAGEEGVGEEGAETSPYEPLLEAARELKEQLTAAERRFRTPPDTKGIVRREGVDWEISYALWSLGGWGAPTPTDLAHLDQAEASLRAALEELNRLFAEEVEAFRQQVLDSGLELLPVAEPLSVEADGSGG